VKTKQPPSSFNLPVLLSFNELAWIAIFGMALACVYAWRQIDEIPILKKKVSEQRETIASLQNASTNFALISNLTNQIAESERGNERLIVLLAEQRKETTKFSNLWERAMVTNAALTQANDNLADDLARNNVELSEFRRQLAELKDQNRSLSNQLVVTSRSTDVLIGELEKARLKPPTSEGEIRQELLSLKGGAAGGTLSNVVVLLDRSSSMDAEKGKRWRDATNVVNTWLSYLPIKNCVLVTFNDRCKVFPSDGSWLRINETNRNTLVAQLNGLKPEGFTDTLAALQTAYGYTNADTIILFTDGKPERAPRDGSRQESMGGRGSKEMIKDIHLLCTNRLQIIPVNTVGLGDYFSPDLAGFLRQLANETKGTFIGR